MKKFFEELSRRLREGGVESSNVEDRRLEIFLHGQPVLFVSPGNDVFLFPAGSNNPEASELYHRVAQTADEVYTYVEEVQTAPTLHISGLSEKFHLLADFGGAVLAGRELENGRGYQFVTWIWDYNRTGVSYGHYYDEDFCGAKQDFAVRSGLISKTQLFSPEELTELYEGKTSLDESHGLVEWQADALATALLMPLPQIKRSFYRLRAGRSNEQLVAEMAQIFQVSKQAMRIRLETRNLI